MNNPFDYEPSLRMLEEQNVLIGKINILREQDDQFREEVDKGKMFGILLTKEHAPLYAYSGQICGKANHKGFIPAVFDYLQEDGYFKVHEREISDINHRITELASSSRLADLRSSYTSLKAEAKSDIADYQMQIKAAKAERDIVRGKGLVDNASLIRESQFMKAELHRKKLAWKERLESKAAEILALEGDIRHLKLERQHKSDLLQRWLFEQFVFNGRNLIEIFRDYSIRHNLQFNGLPPSGSGECCEPKLLHHAITNGFTPVEMGMFWWGESPKQEIRHHLQFYPACNSKCKPILSFLLNQDFDACVQTIGKLHIIHEDEHIIVVNKPAGMLSVPGKTSKPSVYSILSEKNEELYVVHRLDMDTSGLLVLAKDKESYKDLQQQFAKHTIKKTYIALLEHEVKGNGVITLPLCPNIEDRPRQMVSEEYGKETITEYNALGGNRIELHPLTGRTHQLRVHCAHKDGLNNPIKGDRLYGHRANRLYLHAQTLELTHSATKERMTFSVKPNF